MEKIIFQFHYQRIWNKCVIVDLKLLRFYGFQICKLVFGESNKSKYLKEQLMGIPLKNRYI